MFGGMFYPVNPVAKMQVPIHYDYTRFGKNCKGKMAGFSGEKESEKCKGKRGKGSV